MLPNIDFCGSNNLCQKHSKKFSLWFLQSVEYQLHFEKFLSNSIDMVKNLPRVARSLCPKNFVDRVPKQWSLSMEWWSTVVILAMTTSKRPANTFYWNKVSWASRSRLCCPRSPYSATFPLLNPRTNMFPLTLTLNPRVPNLTLHQSKCKLYGTKNLTYKTQIK